jgi:DNA-binding NarL/FixJ family response regulator
VSSCLLADDHPALVAAVHDLLTQNGFDVIGPALHGESAVALARSETPELAVVDYRMPHLSGRELLARLKAEVPGLRVVVYTAEADERLVREILEGGADGIVLKQSPLHDLIRALETVRDGGTYIDPALAAFVINGGAPAGTPLTERERDVLSRLSGGRSHAQIGQELGIGVETVRTHLKKACEKLSAVTRTQAVATALRLGLIE